MTRTEINEALAVADLRLGIVKRKWGMGRCLAPADNHVLVRECGLLIETLSQIVILTAHDAVREND